MNRFYPEENKKNMTITERKAIINLLDDPDESVYYHIREKILQSGNQLIPALEEAAASHPDPLVLKRADELVRHIMFNQLSVEWKEWLCSPGKNLLQPAVMLAKHQYPSGRPEDEIISPIEKISRDIWLEMNDEMTHFEKILIINKILFSIYGFTCFPGTDRLPHLLFLNDVLNSKRGHACAITWLYLIVAQQNKIPVMGVDIRGRYLLCLPEETNHEKYSENLSSSPVLFYINPSREGAIYSKKDADLLFLGKKNRSSSGNIHRSDLQGSPFPSTPMQNRLKPCGNETMMMNILRQYSYDFRKDGRQDKANEMNALINLTLQWKKQTAGEK